MTIILYSNTDIINHIGRHIEVSVGVFVDGELTDVNKTGILTHFDEVREYIKWTLPDGTAQPVLHKSSIINLL